MSLEQWRTDEEREQTPLNNEDIDLMNDETFGDGDGDGDGVVSGNWEANHYSSLLNAVKQNTTDSIISSDNRQILKTENIDCNGKRTESDNISHFERLGLKDLWESSPDTSTCLDSIWTPSTLPQPEKIISPTHTSSKSNIVSVQDLEKSIMDSTSGDSPSQSPPHSPLLTNVLPLPLRNLHSSPSPPPPSHPIMGMFPRHPAPRPLMFPHARLPPPGFPMMRPHPHQQHFMPPSMVPLPYYTRGPIPPPQRFPTPFLPPNVPLLGPPRMIRGFPLHPSLVLRHSPMGPIPMHPADMQHNLRYSNYHQQRQPNPMSYKLNEMLYDLQPDGSGFMTRKEKEWVIKVQLIQLHSSNPETDDYYYQKFIQQRYNSNNEEGVVTSSDTLTPLTLPPPVSDHKERTCSDFEGTLGKVSVGSVSAPRKTIDITPPTSNDPKTDATSRKKQALITIEKMYTVLLHLDDLQPVISIDDNDDNVMEKKTGFCNELLSLIGLSEEFLVTRDYSCFQQLMSFRKGKRLFKRLLPYLDVNKSKVALLCFSKNITPIIKKDTQDKILPELLPMLSTVINTCDMSELRNIVNLLQPLLSSKYSNNPFFISFVTLVVNKGYQISSSWQPPNDWASLLSEMNYVLLKSKTKSEALSKVLTTPPTN